MTAKKMADSRVSGLTPKQEKFCYAYLQTGNASEAYRQAYNTGNMKPESVNRKAKELLDNGKVAARISKITTEASKRNHITIDALIDELEEARKVAEQNSKAADMVNATMGKAKMLGFLRENVLGSLNVHHTHNTADLSDEELAAELARYGIES